MEGNAMWSSKGRAVTCKAALCWSPGEPLVIEEIQVAPPRASEVRIKIICTALCHTDLSFWKNPELTELPRIFGHEAVGTVESVGEHVKDLKEGDLVVPVFLGECRECADCKSERSNLCVNLPVTASGVMRSDNTSRFSVNGKPAYHFMNVSSFSEYTVVDSCCVVKITPTVPPDKASLLGCGVSTGFGAVWKVAKVEKGSTVAIFGLGTVGLAVAEGARINGASRIIGVDVREEKFEIGKKFGVTDMVNPKNHDKAVNKGWGMTVVLGVDLKKTQLTMESRLLLRGRSVKGSLFGGIKPKSDIPTFVDMYMKNELRLDDFISHEVSFWEINKAFDLMLEGKCLRCVIWMDPSKLKLSEGHP